MVGTVTQLNIAPSTSERAVFFEHLSAPGSTSPAVRLQGRVVVQIAGTATDIEAVVEHATQDPGSSQEDWAPAENEIFDGNLSLGMAPRQFEEPAIGWWRVRVTTLVGGYARISIIGDST